MKKILIFITVLVTSLYLASCRGNDQMDFKGFVKAIYNSEQIMAGYNESNIILDGDFEVYNKLTNFKISRGENVKSEVKIVEKKLSTSGNQTYDETVTNYTTFHDKKYTVIKRACSRTEAILEEVIELARQPERNENDYR